MCWAKLRNQTPSNEEKTGTSNCSVTVSARSKSRIFGFESSNLPIEMIQLLLVLGILVLTPVVASSDGHSTSDPSISTRIAGGNDASESYPFFILWGGCGATLIHNDIALTAAHCSKKPHAQVGAHKRGGESGWTNVDRVIRHPDYDPETYDYDVAVFRLGGWFEQSTVKLNEIESVPTPGTSLTMLGFGGEASALQEAKVNYITPSICAEEWREYGYTIDSTSMICAGDTDADVCTGKTVHPLALWGEQAFLDYCSC